MVSGFPKLAISDGTTYIELHSPTIGLHLADWRPGRADLKGGGVWQSSPLSDGRALRQARYDNARETFTLRVSDRTQDGLIRHLQEVDRLLVKARQYWTTDWQSEPVWIEAKGPRETNIRYAMLYDYRVAGDANPYTQSFFQCLFEKIGMDDVTLVVERGHWASRPPCGRDVIREGTYEPTESADDADVNYLTSTIILNNARLSFGNEGGGNFRGCGIRFRNVGIRKGARILNAYIEFVAGLDDLTNQCNCWIHGERNGFPALFTTYTDFIGRDRTLTSVGWHDISDWTAGVIYRSPDLTDIVQEIVSLDDWQMWANLVIFVEKLNSSAGARRRPAAWDSTVYDPPKLHVTWIENEDECFDCVPVGNLQEHEADSSYYIPWISADDGYAYSGGIPSANIAEQHFYVGCTNTPAGDFSAGIRFRRVCIQPGSIITDARLVLIESDVWTGGGASFNIYGLDLLSSPPFTATYANWVTLSAFVSTAFVAWTPASGGLGTVHTSGNISSIIQEIINQTGWEFGNDLSLWLDNTSSCVLEEHISVFASWDNTTYLPPRLYIKWTDPNSISRGAWANCEGSLVANKHSTAHITHVFWGNAAGTEFGPNLVEMMRCGVCMPLFPNGAVANGDALYIIVEDDPFPRPFDNVIWNVSIPAAYEGLGANEGLISQYWDGFAWVAFPSCHDNTWDNGGMFTNYKGPFNTPGLNSVHWFAETDFATTTVNTVTGFAVRVLASFTSGTISCPHICDRPPYTCVTPYVEIGEILRGVWTPLIGTDDASLNITTTTVTTGGTQLSFGRGAVNRVGSLIRFRGVNIPRNATILEARLGFQAVQTNAVRSCNVLIRGELNAYPDEFSTYADYAARRNTSVQASWLDVPSWTIGAYHFSADFAEVVQEIVNVGNWSRGCDMALFVLDNGTSDINTDRIFAALEHGTYRAVRLCIAWTEDPPGGDIELLARITAGNKSAGSHYGFVSNEIFAGLRSLARGENYTPYINLGDRQNPDQILVTDLTAASTIINDVRAPSGRCIEYDPGAGPYPMSANEIRIRFESSWADKFYILREYVGTYRCFLRLYVNLNDDPSDLQIQLGFLCGSSVYETEIKSPTTIWNYELLDFGRVTLPTGGIAGLDNPWVQDIFIRLTSVARVRVRFYDLILFPIDEWAGDCFDPQSDLFGSPSLLTLYAATRVEFDSLTNPKDQIRSPVRYTWVNVGLGYSTVDYSRFLGKWISIANGPTIVQSNRNQRLWFLASYNNSVPQKQAHAMAAHEINLYAIQRYLSMRGGR